MNWCYGDIHLDIVCNKILKYGLQICLKIDVDIR